MQDEQRMCTDSSPACPPCSCASGQRTRAHPKACSLTLREEVKSSAMGRTVKGLDIWDGSHPAVSLGKSKQQIPREKGLVWLPSRGRLRTGSACVHRAPSATHCSSAASSCKASLGLENRHSCRITAPQECHRLREKFFVFFLKNNF